MGPEGSRITLRGAEQVRPRLRAVTTVVPEPALGSALFTVASLAEDLSELFGVRVDVATEG
jgi:predicted nucleotidyltransferase